MPMRLKFLRQTPPFDRMLFLLSRWTPPLDRVLFIESGSRKVAEQFIEHLYLKEKAQTVDVLTCYSTPPRPFDSAKGRVFYTHDASTGPARERLFRSLASSRYSAICMLCTGHDIMTKWKWAAAMRVPAKVLIVNEHADSFWLDRGHCRDLGRMSNKRLDLRISLKFSRISLKFSRISFKFLRQTPPFDRMLFLLSRWTPPLDRVLFIESGCRMAAEQFVEHLYSNERAQTIDVLTCYSTPPRSFDSAKGRVFFTHDASTGPARERLFRSLAASRYSAICMLCTGHDVMTKWKWIAAMRVPAKVLIVNENADAFWLDRGHCRELGRMSNERLGLSRLAPLSFLHAAIAFPFTFIVLIGFAARVHIARLIRKCRA
jgi:uncharacterized protein YjiS (DUF1127 family)